MGKCNYCNRPAGVEILDDDEMVMVCELHDPNKQVKPTELQVGQKYHAFIEGGDFGDDIVFPDEEFTFLVLPKPKRVIAETIDVRGSESEEIDLPDHLSKPEKYLIRKEGKQSTCWFDAKHAVITKYDGIVLNKIEFYREDNGQYSSSKARQDDVSGGYYQSTDVDELVKNLRERIKELEDNAKANG
ncbi:hypothetical protein VPHD81_0005 [Vibrio phage D81]